MARYISFAVLLAIIVVIGALFYKVMIGFFVPVFLAAVQRILDRRVPVPIDPCLATATVLLAKHSNSIDSQFLSVHGR